MSITSDLFEFYDVDPEVKYFDLSKYKSEKLIDLVNYLNRGQSIRKDEKTVELIDKLISIIKKFEFKESYNSLLFSKIKAEMSSIVYAFLEPIEKLETSKHKKDALFSLIVKWRMKEKIT